MKKKRDSRCTKKINLCFLSFKSPDSLQLNIQTQANLPLYQQLIDIGNYFTIFNDFNEVFLEDAVFLVDGEQGMIFELHKSKKNI